MLIFLKATSVVTKKSPKAAMTHFNGFLKFPDFQKPTNMGTTGFQ